MAEFWAEWGALAYAAAFAWAFFEGETFVLLAAAAGHATGAIDPWLLMLSVWFGSFFGDQVWFTLGRRYGRKAVAKIPGAEKRMNAALGFLDRYGSVFVLSFRFIYGVRNVASAACGIAGMSRARFMLLNFIAAGLWAAAFVAAGWFAVAWLGEKNTFYALLGIGFCAVIYIATRFVLGRRRRNAAAHAGAAAE